MRNLHGRFVLCSNGQIYSGDFAKFCGLLRIYELQSDAIGENYKLISLLVFVHLRFHSDYDIVISFIELSKNKRVWYKVLIETEYRIRKYHVKFVRKNIP